MNKYELKKKRYLRRKKHIRRSIFGTSDKLRLTVFRSSKHIYAQIINDDDRKTLASASTLDKEVAGQLKADMSGKDKSVLVGTVLAKRALDADIKEVVFDRYGFLYHGRVKALADAARKAGLKL